VATPTFTLVPEGPFSLAEAVGFGFGQRDAAAFAGVMRLAFCVDGDGLGAQAGVEVRQDAGGVHCTVAGDADPERVRAQVARVLSLDHDARPYVAIGQRDAVVARLLAAAPGLRPPLFYSPYEAAAWSILSARRPAAAMIALRRRLSEAHGRTFVLADEPLAAFPTPSALLAVEAFPGLPTVKLERLHGVARAALEGRLDVDYLLALGPDAATEALQEIPGIGPFYAGLVVVRATGFTDVLPPDQRRLAPLVGRLYGLPGPPSPEEVERIAEAWRPFRTWVAVLVRSTAARLLD
jgi:DNA-3-methyladenine glycosylase II